LFGTETSSLGGGGGNGLFWRGKGLHAPALPVADMSSMRDKFFLPENILFTDCSFLLQFTPNISFNSFTHITSHTHPHTTKIQKKKNSNSTLYH
jgi:hypothetical protein